jgi:hypothetical protein
MNTLAPIADKLGKLLRMLMSNHDGEVVAAARSINCTLKNAGLDIHALAAAVEAESGGERLSEEQIAEVFRRGQAAGRCEAMNTENWHSVACECAAHDDRLRDERERQFVCEVRRTRLAVN